MKITIIALLTAGMLFSCKKDINSSQTKAQDLQKAINMESLADRDAIEQGTLSWESAVKAEETAVCKAVITVIEGTPGVFPFSMKFDWGPGCTLSNGDTRSGIIIRHYKSDMNMPGGETVTEYDNYVLNGVKIGGKTVIHRQDPTSDGHPIYRMAARDRTTENVITGDAFLTSSTKRVVKLEDDGTNEINFSTGWLRETGGTTGTKTAGSNAPYQFTSTIDGVNNNPLIYKHCPTGPIKGVVITDFTPAINGSRWHVDYGANPNACDGTASLRIDGATPVTAKLPIKLP